MEAPKTDEELIKMVRAGRAQAAIALMHIIESKKDYPGDVADVINLLKDAEPDYFTYALSDLAEAYLLAKGVINESEMSDRWQVEGLLKLYRSPK